MKLIAAHLLAVALSLMAWIAVEAWVFVTVRVLMPPIGAYIAWHASLADDPTWMVAGLASIGVMFLLFFKPGRACWLVLNPLVAIAYLAHLGWMAVTA